MNSRCPVPAKPSHVTRAPASARRAVLERLEGVLLPPEHERLGAQPRQGRHELESRTALVPEWLERLQAPSKRLYWFENAGHSTAMEEFQRFHQIMTDTVLPETYPTQRGH